MKCYEGASHLSVLLVISILLSCTSEAARNSKLERCYVNITKSSSTIKGLALENQRCEKERKCLSIDLPYGTTTIPDYLPEDVRFTTQDEVFRYLQRWQELRHLPRCWQDLQTTLCSMFMPQCDENPETLKIQRISKPSVDSCNDLKNNNHCKFIERQYGWSSFPIFNCSDSRLYSSNCTNELRNERIYSSVASCHYPLVASNETSTWFKDVSGCALHCKYPILDHRDQTNISQCIRTLCSVGLLSTLFASLLFRVNSAGDKPSSMNSLIKRCTICHALTYLGWSIQIIWGTDIACSQGGYALYGLPLVANACVLSFILTYLPSLAYLIWCACLAKQCYGKLVGSEKTVTESTLNILGYGVPTAVLVAVAFLGQIDGHGLFGICTIGQQSTALKIIFILLPNFAGTGYSNYYFFMTIYKGMLFKELKPAKRREFYRIISLTVFSTLQVVFSIGNYFYQLRNQDQWHESIDNHLKCSLQPPRILSDLDQKPPNCSMDTNPLVLLNYFELLSTLVVGITVASWAYTDRNMRGLRRYLIEKLEDEKMKQSGYYSPNFDTNGHGVGYSPANGRSSRASSIDDSRGLDYPSMRLSKHSSLRSTNLSIRSTRSVVPFQNHADLYAQLAAARQPEVSQPVPPYLINDVTKNLPAEDQMDEKKCLEWLKNHPELQDALISLNNHPNKMGAYKLVTESTSLFKFLTYLSLPDFGKSFREEDDWLSARQCLCSFTIFHICSQELRQGKPLNDDMNAALHLALESTESRKLWPQIMAKEILSNAPTAADS